jgi:integrase/recombinase XerD
MAESVFQGPRNGPLVEERRRFLVYCAEQGMSRWTLRNIDIYLVVVARVLRLAKRPGESITRAEIDGAANRWAKRLPRLPRAERQARNRFKGRALRWLSFLGRLQPRITRRPPYAEHVTRFAKYLRLERGLSPRTIESHCWRIDRFLARLDQAAVRVDTVTVAQVDDLLVRMIRDDGYGRSTIQGLVSVLRVFFRHVEARGLCRTGLAAALKAPRVYRYEALPAGPSWDGVQRVIETTRGDKPADIRNRAILVLLAVYGLRLGELAALRLEDFDWEREMLLIRPGKTKRARIYPLCRTVGDVVLRYLQEARPRSADRRLFLRLRAPFWPLSRAAVATAVRQRFHLSGVESPHHGPHALRHACATHLLAHGLSLKEIGDYLGHQSPEATRIYAKVDLTALRVVADVDLEGLR